jgi:hypothetical protein
MAEYPEYKKKKAKFRDSAKYKNPRTRKRSFETLPKIKTQVMAFYCRISLTKGQESAVSKLCQR